MTDGEFGVLYAEVRILNGLSTTQYPDTEVDQHIAEANEETQNALKKTFATTAQTFTDLVLNSSDLFFAQGSKMILYLGEFLQEVNYYPLLSITKVETRSTDNDDFVTETEGMTDDYRVNLITNAIEFNRRLSNNGYKTVRITGTYGVVADPLTDLEHKYKKMIAYIAALKGLTFAVGGGFSTSKDNTVGGISVSEDEFSQTSSKTFERLETGLKDHMKAHGLVRKRVTVSVVSRIGKQTISGYNGYSGHHSY